LRTKEQGTHLTLNEQDDDDDMYITKALFFNTQYVASEGILAPWSGNNNGHS